MRRETTNLARAVLEDWVPPVLRDTRLFAWLARLGLGRRFDEMAELRLNAPVWSEDQFRQFYARMKPSQERRGTDNSRATVRRIVGDAVGTSAVDVGCGHGVLLAELQAARPDLAALTGVDFVIPDNVKSVPGIEWVDASISTLPFGDGAFDTTICTHTLEHVVDLAAAVAELRRVTAKRLILVVPRERPYLHTFNAHLYFFPYPHLFAVAVKPRGAFVCEAVGRDLYYREDVAPG